jgi:hypothetical protein
MREIIKDKYLQNELLEKGYVIVPLLHQQEILEMKRELLSLSPDDNFNPQQSTSYNSASYHCTFLDTNKDYKISCDKILRKYFSREIDYYLENYKYLTGNIYAKQPNSGFFEIHMNWPTSFLNTTTLTLWCPLQDITDINGGLKVVPRSHKIVHDIEAIGYTPYYRSFEKELVEHHFVSLKPKLGECVIFDDTLLHYSEVNLSDSNRFAIQIEYPLKIHHCCFPIKKIIKEGVLKL